MLTTMSTAYPRLSQTTVRYRPLPKIIPHRGLLLSSPDILFQLRLLFHEILPVVSQLEASVSSSPISV